VVATSEKTVVSVDGTISHDLVNLNKLVGEVPGVLGIKTGWTENAKENLVTFVKRDDRQVVIAMLASNDRFGETKKLIDFIFENYSWELSPES
jgi:D-alanyl-D-alanine carboxypeptidase (penicillin-binding protein 5/6)